MPLLRLTPAAVALAIVVGTALPVTAQTSQGPLQGRVDESAQEASRGESLWALETSLWRGPAVGEDYTLELTGSLWSPAPAISASSEQFGITGTTIDFERDLGLVRQSHREARLTFKPARRHKLRVSYLPMRYQQTGVLPREIIFQGIRYDAGVPVSSSMTWNVWRLGYEFDVVSLSRGYLGVILEAKYTDIRAELESPADSEFARARAPIPAVGAILRVYVTRFTPITAEVTAFQLPRDLVEDYRARLVDFDVYGTVNLTRMVGISLGYRSLDLRYLFQRESGDFKVEGAYISGAFRF